MYNVSVSFVQGCCLTNNSMGEFIHLFTNNIPVSGIGITTSCSTSDTNNIDVFNGGDYVGAFQGPVECSPQGGDSTTQSSSTTGTITQDDGDGDKDRDGKLDANDNCPNLPHTRCYKEGDTAIIVHNSNR